MKLEDRGPSVSVDKHSWKEVKGTERIRVLSTGPSSAPNWTLRALLNFSGGSARK